MLIDGLSSVLQLISMIPVIKIMKQENSEFKRTTTTDLSNLPTRSPLSRRTQQFESPAATKKQIDDESPAILKQERYGRLFGQILNDTKKAYKYLSQEEAENEKAAVRRSIGRILKQGERESQFNERFLLKPKLRAKTAIVTKKNSHVGFTSLQQQAEKRKCFFSNHKKSINLEQECMLLEYFLKDEDEHQKKTSINYLFNIDSTSRHRRMTPRSKDVSELYSSHNEREYASLKRKVHLKEEFVQRCVGIAKKNLTYRRRQNFKEIEFILQQNNRIMMEQSITQGKEQEEKLERNNKLIRLFLNYEFFFYQIRNYEYFNDPAIKKFKEDLINADESYAGKTAMIDEKIHSIMEFKQRKNLQFHDFQELIIFISEATGKDVLRIFINKYPEYFSSREETVLNDHEVEIEKYMSSHKIKFLLQMIFNTFPEKLIGKMILPVKMIPSFFKAYGITEKDYNTRHLFHCYHWMQHYDAGVTFEEFYKGSLLLGMRGGNWKGIESFLRKINIKAYV